MKRKTAWILGGVLTLAIIGGIAFAIYMYLKLNEDAIELEQVAGDLAYMTNADGDWDIVLLDSAETKTVLTQGEGQDYFFNFTFNGDIVNFYSTRSGEFTPALVNADGSDLQTMSWMAAFATMFNNKDFDPAWSPGGAKLAWTSLRGMNTSLMIANADGSGEERLTNRKDSDMRLAWSPDGARIAFIADRESKGEQWQVWVVEVASGEATQITPDDLYCYQMAWSLDGARLLVAAKGDGDIMAGEFELLVMNADGSDLHPLAADEVFEGDPSYAPDGSQIAYMSNQDGHWQIYLMDADGANARSITEGEADHLFPAWRPVPASAAEDTASES